MKKILIVMITALILSFTLLGCQKASDVLETDHTPDADLDRKSQAQELSAGEISFQENAPLNIPEAASTEEIITTMAALPDRIPGSENNEKAAKWIAGQFELYELKPLIKEDYFWPYEQNMNGQSVIPDNVVGCIEGQNAKKAVIISCHFDAVEGSTGAVDNASGVAAMLRTVSGVLLSDSKSDVDYIFCAFNGEEQNYAGSKAFVEELKGQYETVSNINYDCVGVIDGGNYMFGAEETEVGYPMNKEMRLYLEKYNITYGSYPVSGVRSDHISFENAKIPNINFTQIGISSFTHSSNDQAEQLDTEQINLLADCVVEYLSE